MPSYNPGGSESTPGQGGGTPAPGPIRAASSAASAKPGRPHQSVPRALAKSKGTGSTSLRPRRASGESGPTARPAKRAQQQAKSVAEAREAVTRARNFGDRWSDGEIPLPPTDVPIRGKVMYGDTDPTAREARHIARATRSHFDTGIVESFAGLFSPVITLAIEGTNWARDKSQREGEQAHLANKFGPEGMLQVRRLFEQCARSGCKPQARLQGAPSAQRGALLPALTARRHGEDSIDRSGVLSRPLRRRRRRHYGSGRRVGPGGRRCAGRGGRGRSPPVQTDSGYGVKGSESWTSSRNW